MEIEESQRLEIYDEYLKWYRKKYFHTKLINHFRIVNFKQLYNILSRLYITQENKFDAFDKFLDEIDGKSKKYRGQFSKRPIDIKQVVKFYKDSQNINDINIIYTYVIDIIKNNDKYEFHVQFNDLSFTGYYDIIYDQQYKLKYSPESIIKLILRYDPLFPKHGEFWSMPLKIHKYLNRGPKNVIECFASPFNHYSLNYFSLFPEDNDFGSSGSFFTDYQLYDFTDQTLIFDPPYIETIINDSVDIIHNILTEFSNVIVISLFPHWPDFPGFKEMSSSKYKIVQYQLINYNVYSFVAHAHFTPGRVLMELFILSNTNNIPYDIKYIKNKLKVGK